MLVSYLNTLISPKGKGYAINTKKVCLDKDENKRLREQLDKLKSIK